jgi:hypothetical protein
MSSLLDTIPIRKERIIGKGKVRLNRLSGIGVTAHLRPRNSLLYAG